MLRCDGARVELCWVLGEYLVLIHQCQVLALLLYMEEGPTEATSV